VVAEHGEWVVAEPAVDDRNPERVLVAHRVKLEALFGGQSGVADDVADELAGQELGGEADVRERA
jgi:hypothetical protein